MAKQNQKNQKNTNKNTAANKETDNNTNTKAPVNDQSGSSAENKETKTGKPNKDRQPFQPAAFLELIRKYRRYLAAGVLFIAMVVVLVKCTGPADDTPKEPVQDEQTDQQGDLSEEFQIDAIPEINTLVADYYKAYADGDVTALEQLARPVSDTEKSYIKVFSEYVDSYDKLSCYTKSGLGEGEYVVSVYLEMKFKDVATAAPGLDFFYVCTDESGQFYIDNAYSQFNQSNMENSTEADVQALINEFEQAEDVLALQAEVQQKYEQAIAADEQLATMANETIPNAISAWVESLTAPEDADKAEDTDKASDKKDSEDSDKDTSDDKKDDKDDPDKKGSKDKDTDKDDSDGKAKTAYATDGIYLRKGPGTDKKVVTQIAYGDKLKIYPDTKKDGWVKAVYKKKKGYVKLEYVTTKKSEITGERADDTADTPAALEAGKKITLSDSVNVRVSMSETADKVGLAYQGDTVEIIQSYAEGWTKVKWNGETGYIKTELIK